MFSFFKQWSENLGEYRELQKELTEIFRDEMGVNFMHLHPEINKCMVGIAREEGAREAVNQLHEMTKSISENYPHASQEESKKRLVTMCTMINNLAKK